MPCVYRGNRAGRSDAVAVDPVALRRARVRAGLSQLRLAERCGWRDQQRVSEYERGLRWPSAGAMAKTREAMRCVSSFHSRSVSRSHRDF